MPLTAKQITHIIGLKEDFSKEGANMRSIIHALRVKGYPICANGRLLLCKHQQNFPNI